MINKIYKSIHNKYSTLFKFLFFLRYLFAIFFTSVVLFLLIPHFFDFKKKDDVFKNYLLKNYGFKLNKYETIKYNSLPIPNLQIQNAEITLRQKFLKLNVSNLVIYPKLLNIYNYDNFKSKKIILIKNELLLEDTNVKFFINYIFNLKKRLIFENLNLVISRKGSSLVDIKKINFSNYGYNKNVVTGLLFNKKFKILINENYNKINFKLFKTGIIADINFNEVQKESIKSGVFKSKLLKSNLKFNFDYDDKKLKIYNSYFRNKDLSFDNQSVITYHPFFSSRSTFNIEDINIKLLKKIDINKILELKNLIKKINTNNEISFKPKRLSTGLIDNFKLDINLAYGKLIFTKKILISESLFTCSGEINLLNEYPILYYDCLVISEDKKKLLKEFLIKYKNKNESFKLNIKGNINILNNKINFKNISSNNYEATKEDLNYLKNSFETIIFDQDFISIFNMKKIKEFILEIS
jgi:hypothetical protein